MNVFYCLKNSVKSLDCLLPNLCLNLSKSYYSQSKEASYFLGWQPCLKKVPVDKFSVAALIMGTNRLVKEEVVLQKRSCVYSCSAAAGKML